METENQVIPVTSPGEVLLPPLFVSDRRFETLRANLERDMHTKFGKLFKKTPSAAQRLAVDELVDFVANFSVVSLVKLEAAREGHGTNTFERFQKTFVAITEAILQAQAQAQATVQTEASTDANDSKPSAEPGHRSEDRPADVPGIADNSGSV